MVNDSLDPAVRERRLQGVVSEQIGLDRGRLCRDRVRVTFRQVVVNDEWPSAIS
jgi:hypothetical protein